MTELEAKKQHATIVGDLESDFESDEKSDTEWQPRDKKKANLDNEENNP